MPVMGKSRSYMIVDDDMTGIDCYSENWKLPPGYDQESESMGTLRESKSDRPCVPYYYPSRLDAIEEEECESFDSQLSAFILPMETYTCKSSAEFPSLSAPRLNRQQQSHYRPRTLHSNAMLKKANNLGTGARHSANPAPSYPTAAPSPLQSSSQTAWCSAVAELYFTTVSSEVCSRVDKGRLSRDFGANDATYRLGNRPVRIQVLEMGEVYD